MEGKVKYNKLWDIISGSLTKPEREDREEYEKDLCARMEILMDVSDGPSKMLRNMGPKNVDTSANYLRTSKRCPTRA